MPLTQNLLIHISLCRESQEETEKKKPFPYKSKQVSRIVLREEIRIRENNLIP